MDTQGGCWEKRTRTMETKIENREPRKRHELAFKRDCVALHEKSGKSLKAFAAEMGVSHWNLRDRRRLYRTPTQPRSAEATEAELLRLRREVESLRPQRDLLKKPWASLPNPSRTLRAPERDGERTPCLSGRLTKRR